MRSTALPRTCLICLLAAPAITLMAGCAGQSPIAQPDPHSVAPLASGDDKGTQAPTATRAWIDTHGQVIVHYLDESQTLAAVAVGTRRDDDRSLPAKANVAVLMPLDPTSSLQIPEADRRPVVIRSASDWGELVRHLAIEAATLVPGDGVVLDVLREDELFLYIDEQGRFQAVPLADKPRAIEPALSLTFEELISGANARMRREMPGAQRLLFDSGDPDYPFVLLFLDEERTLFLRRPPAGEQVTTHSDAPVHALRATYHTLTSQVRGLTTQPFTTVARLLTGVGSTAVDSLPRLRRWDEQRPPPPVADDATPMDLTEWERLLDTLAPNSATSGRIDYLVDGKAFFPALIHAIGAAEHAIRIRLYIFDNDDYAVKIADMLRARSAQVPVEILLDGLGTITGSMAQPEFRPNSASSAPVSIANYLRNGSQVRVRMLPNPWLQGDHTKTLIFDREIAFLGGMNIGREYRYEWHDLMAALEGPVVDELIRDFDQAWKRAGLMGELRATLATETPAMRPSADADHPLRLLYTRPGNSEILRTQIAALRNARERIWVQNAYLTSDRILDELIAARRRGVDVRVILPYYTDAGFIGRSNVLAANLLLRHGVRVYIYPGMSHVKAAIYDGWACLGSANFDRLSLRLNRETNVATSDPDAVERLIGQVFAPDFTRSLELTEPMPARWLDYLQELIADQL